MITHNRPTENYTEVPREFINNISPKSMKLALYISSKPSQHRYFAKEIVIDLKMNKEDIRASFKELDSIGWIVKDRYTPQGQIYKVLPQNNEKGYVKIPNIIAYDHNITYTALAVYIYLCSRPSNWKICNEDVRKQIHMKTEASVTRAWKVLLAGNYISRDKRGNGSFDYTITKLEDIKGYQITKINKDASENSSVRKDSTPLVVKTKHKKNFKAKLAMVKRKLFEKAQAEIEKYAEMLKSEKETLLDIWENSTRELKNKAIRCGYGSEFIEKGQEDTTDITTIVRCVAKMVTNWTKDTLKLHRKHKQYNDYRGYIHNPIVQLV